MKFPALLVLFSICNAASLSAQGEKVPVRLTDLLKLQQIQHVAIAPDGRQVAYAVRSIENDAYLTQVYLTSLDGRSAPRQLTRGNSSASHPAWHPGGERLAFVREVDRVQQIFILPLEGGEAWQLTDSPHGATAPRWSPDGTRILFTSRIEHADVAVSLPSGVTPDPDGNMQQIRAWLHENAGKGNPRVFNRLNLQEKQWLVPDPAYNHLYVIEAREGAQAAPITRGFFSFSGGDWSPDGRYVFFSGAADSSQHPDLVRQKSLYMARSNGSTLDRFLRLDGYTIFNPVVSPDGLHVAFLARSLEDPGFAQTQIGIVPIEGGETRILTESLDRSVTSLKWSSDGWYLYFTAPANGDIPLFRLPAHGRAPVAEDPEDDDEPTLEESDTIERITGPGSGVGDFDLGRASVAYVLTRVSNPYELYVAQLNGDRARMITEHNAVWLANRQLSVPDRYHLTRIDTIRSGDSLVVDTLTIDYWVMRPTSYERGRRFPLMLQLHGGPSAMWGPGEAAMWHEFQFFAGRGYGIVYSNPRGSGGYGRAFQRANYQDGGSGPAGDVLAAVSAAARQPWVDPDRQVVTGGSCAGSLLTWIIAHDDRFQAAVAQRGVYDLSTFSPLTFVDSIHTPLLIKHADLDLRTGVSQNEMLYESLKILDRPVEYVRYPGAGHELSRSGDPTQRFDRILRTHEFMYRYIGGSSTAPSPSQALDQAVE